MTDPITDRIVDSPNGWGLSSSVNTLYVTESEPGRVYSSAYDESTGELSNRDVS